MIFSSVFILGSCTSYKIIPNNTVIDSLNEKTCTKILNHQYPDSFALTQHILLTVAGKQYDFIGQLTMDRGAAYRAVAFGEMGGQFIDLLVNDDSISILSNPANLPENPIRQGVAEDISQLFFYKNITKVNCSDLADSLFKVTINISKDDQIIYLLNSNNNQILNLNCYSGNKLTRTVEFLDYYKQNGWDPAMPSYIKLTNHRWHYALEIRLLKFNMKYDAGKVFNIN